MKKILIGVVIGICVPFVLCCLFMLLGGMPVATKGNPLPMEKFIARMALNAAMGKETAETSPLQADEPNLLAGAKIYKVQCEVCHGQLGQPEFFIAKGMFPHPPQLLPPKRGVTNDPIGEIYWKVKNGIRLTGMPGYVDNLTDTEMWQVSLLMLHADKLPAPVQQVLRK